MEEIIEALLDAADEVSMPDNTRGKAVQCQLTLVGKEISGALTRALDKNGDAISGLYKLLSVGTTQDKQAVLVEVYVDVQAVQCLNRIMPKPLIEVPALQ